MRDFSIVIYRALLDALQGADYTFQTFHEFLEAPAAKSVVLRHDVDVRKFNSLKFAKIQHERGIKATYYFRVVPSSYDEGVIKEIYSMGHEIGYHYEDMDFAKGDPHKAVKLFEEHLDRLRKLAPISTICMHGSPGSKFDNKDVWKHYNYQDYNLIGEPYFDIDFSKVFYITDTGRKWNGTSVSVRDKVDSPFNLSFNSTHEIIKSIEQNIFPEQVMFNFHPQRWMDFYFAWLAEKHVQTLKNVAKYWLIKWRNSQEQKATS